MSLSPHDVRHLKPFDYARILSDQKSSSGNMIKQKLNFGVESILGERQEDKVNSRKSPILSSQSISRYQNI